MPSLLWAEEPAKAKHSFDMCPADSYSSFNFTPPRAFPHELIETTQVSAEQVENIGNAISLFTGHVLIEKHHLRLTADEVSHDQNNQRLELRGNIHIDTGNMSVRADNGWIDTQKQTAEFSNSHYYIPDAHFSGSTPTLSITDDNKTILVDSQFSTCPPGQKDWYLDSTWLELNQASATGTATHSTLWFKGLPLFYFPWIQFPLGEERRSGFLYPGVGFSNRKGSQLSVPWYWNIAPNQDLLFTPSYMSKRGTTFLTDYRYLSQSSKGNLNLEYLSNDKLLNQERYLLHFDNKSQITKKLSLNILANDASDPDYLQDFGVNIKNTNITHLEKKVKLSYTESNWKAGLMVQDFQTIDQEILAKNRPYKRQPQITLQAKDQLAEFGNAFLSASFNSEWVDFKHESTEKVQGSRFYVNPKLNLVMEGNAWFIKPSLGYNLTQYNTIATDGIDQNLENRGLSTLSLDSGLFFERDFSNSPLVLTLEPRLYYLNTPYKDQSLLPIFDSSKQSFTFSSLFRENRFNGIDRIGDSNQVTLALSSRLLNSNNGHELISLSLGQIHYFKTQRVAFDNNPAISDSNSPDTSDIITELRGNLGKWRGRATVQINTQSNASDKRSVQLNYAASNTAVFNLGYRFHRDPLDELKNLEQTDLSFSLPITNQITLLSRWNYSLVEQRDIQMLAGIGYESCCWAMRLVTLRYLTEDEDVPYSNSIKFQFILKGFGSKPKKKASTMLTNAILGYQPDY